MVSRKCEPDTDLSNYNSLQSVVFGECKPEVAVSVTMVCSLWYLGNVNQKLLCLLQWSVVSGKCEPDIDLSNYDGFQSVVSGKCEPDIDLSDYDGLQSVVSGKCEPDIDLSNYNGLQLVVA